MSYDGTLVFDTAIDTKGFITNLGKLGAGVSKVMLATGAAIVGLGTAAAKVGSDFEAATSQIAATMNKPKEEIQDIIAEAKRLGSTTAFTASQAAEGFNILAMSGLDASQQIAVAGKMLDLAAAGGLSLNDAASYLTGTIKGFNEEFDGTINGINTAQYFSDMLAKGASLANTDVNMLGRALSDAAATAHSYGQSADRTTLALLRLAEQNVTGSEAATSLNRAMMDLYTPTTAAKAALDELGVSAYTEAGEARDLNTVVDELNAALAGMSDEQRNAYKNTIFTTFGLQAFNKMTVSSTEKVQEFEEGLSSASDGMGAAATMAATQLDNLKGKLTILQSGLEGLGLSIYEEMQAPLSNAVDFAQELVNDLQAAFDENGIAGAVSAAGGIVAKIAQKLTQEAPKFIDAAVGLIHSFCEGIKNADGIVEAGTDLIMSLIKGIVSAGGDLISTAGFLIIELAGGIAQKLPEIAAVGIDIFKTLTSSITENLPGLIPVAMNALLEFSRSLRENFGLLVDAGLEMIMALAGALIDGLPVFIETIPEIITNICGLINDNAPKLVVAGVELIVQLAKGIIKAIPTLIKNIPQIIKAILAVFSAVNWVNLGKTIIQGIAKGIKGVATKVPQAIKNIGKTAKDWLSAIQWKTLGKDIIDLIGIGIKSVAQSIPRMIKTMADAVVNVFSQLPGRIWKWLANIITYAITWGANIYEKMSTAAAKAIAAVSDWFAKLPGKIWAWLSDVVTRAITWGANLLNTCSTAAANTIANVNNWFSQLPGKIWTWLVDIINKVLIWGADLLSKASTAASNTIAKVTEWFSTLPGKIWTHLTTIINNVLTWGADLLSKASTAASNTVAKVTEWFSTLPGKVWAHLTTIINNVLTWGADLLSKASTAASNTVNKVTEWFSGLPGKIWAHLSTIISNVVTWGADLLSKASTAASNTVAKVVEWFSGLPGKIWTWLTNVITNVNTWAADLQSKASTAASNAVSSVVEWFSGLPGKVWTHLTNVITNVTTFASDLAAKASSAASGFVSALVDGVSGLPSTFYDIGSNIVSGIWNGISAGWNWLTSSVANLAQSLLQSAKDALGINSPSKEFEEQLGQWIPPGIGRGVEKAMPALLDQMDADMEELAQRMKAKVDMETGGITVKQKAAGEHRAATDATAPGNTYVEEKFEQHNEYHVPVASPSEVSKSQREAARKLLGGVK